MLQIESEGVTHVNPKKKDQINKCLSNEDALGVLWYDAQERRRKKWQFYPVSEVMKMSRYVSVESSYMSIYWNRCKIQIEWNRSLPDEVHEIIKIGGGKIALAGGALCHVLKYGSISDTDYDFFFIGCTKEEIEALMFKVSNYLKSEQGPVLNCYINEKVATFMTARNEKHSELKLQFITSRSYASLDQVVGGFDIPFASLIFDGSEIWMTFGAVVSWLSCSIILDHTRRSTTYEHRIRKYMDKYGLVLIVPALPPNILSKLLKEQQSRSPFRFEKVHFDICKGLRVFHDREKWKVPGNRNAESSDYSSGSKHGISIANMRALAREEYHNVTVLSGDGYRTIGEAYTPIYDLKNHNTDGYLKYFFSDYFEKLGPLSQVQRDNLIDIKQREITLRAEWIGSTFFQRPKLFYGPDDNPGRQHTSSFNPIVENPRQYYHFLATFTKIGILDETYFLLKVLFNRFGGGRDVVRLVCGHLADMMMTELRDKVITFKQKNESN